MLLSVGLVSAGSDACPVSHRSVPLIPHHLDSGQRIVESGLAPFNALAGQAARRLKPTVELPYVPIEPSE
jgi:hypothetical protein